MQVRYIYFLLMAFVLAACGGSSDEESSNPVTGIEEESSSSTVQSSSSKENIQSSSSTPEQSTSEESSSSLIESSSSMDVSSSSEDVSSSSQAESSDSESSSSEEEPVGCKSGSIADYPLVDDYLNPDINYGELVDERDGQVYKTVVIGRQTWMAQNLAFERDSSCVDSLKSSAKFGALYKEYKAFDLEQRFSSGRVNGHLRGICPEGWHIPTHNEFVELHTYLKMTYDSLNWASNLKSKDGWYIYPSSGEVLSKGGLNGIGFSAIPINLGASFWADDSVGSYEVLKLNHTKDEVWPYNYESFVVWDGWSIRCIKDTVYEPVPPCKNGEADNCEYGTFIDERDSQEYKTVHIGPMEWMAENIRFNTANFWTSNSDKDTGERYYIAEHAIKTACPEGWMLPNRSLWEMLFDLTGARENAEVLYSTEGWDAGEQADGYGFSLKPTGKFVYAGSPGKFEEVGVNAYYCYEAKSTSGKLERYIEFGKSSCKHPIYASINTSTSTHYYSVRCVKRQTW